MKRINILITSGGDEGKPEAINNDSEMSLAEIEASTTTLNQLIKENPALLQDPEVKNLIDLSEAFKEDLGVVEETETETEETETGTAEEVEEKKEEKKPAKKTPEKKEKPKFENPFAQEDEHDFSDVTKDNFDEVLAETFGVDTKQKNYLQGFLTEVVSTRESLEALRAKEEEYNGFVETLNSLPKEIQMAIRAYANGENWKAVIGTGAKVDFGKSFEKMTAAEKVAVHNFYFNDDTLPADADLDDKAVAKSIKLAERAFIEDKNKLEAARVQKEKDDAARAVETKKALDAAIKLAEKKFPKFPKRDFEKIVHTVKSGIHQLFYDNNGVIKEDAIVKLLLADKGETLLNYVANISENRGKSKGKQEVIKTNKKPETKSGGGPALTNSDKTVKNIVASMTQELTY